MNRKKVIMIIASFVLLALIIVFGLNIFNFKHDEDVYIIFNTHTDTFVPYNWEIHDSILPSEFNPQAVNMNMEELTKLDSAQKNYYDSIMKTDFKYPKKVIKTDGDKKEYFISISDLISIKLNAKKVKKIKEIDLKKLNIISIDSLIQLFPELHYEKKESNNYRMKFHIIESNKKSSEIYCVDVSPTIIEYN